MPALKLFASQSVVIVPRRWMTAMGAPDYHQQANVAATGMRKDAVAQMIAMSGAHPGMVSEMRLQGDSVSTAIRELVEAGVINFEEPGLWAWPNRTLNSTVIRIRLTVAEKVARRNLRYRPGTPEHGKLYLATVSGLPATHLRQPPTQPPTHLREGESPCV